MGGVERSERRGWAARVLVQGTLQPQPNDVLNPKFILGYADHHSCTRHSRPEHRGAPAGVTSYEYPYHATNVSMFRWGWPKIRSVYLPIEVDGFPRSI